MTTIDRELKSIADGQTLYAIMVRSLALKTFGNYTMKEFSSDGDVIEKSTPGMGVTVSNGAIYVNGSVVGWSVGGDLTVGTAHTTYDRFDLIVADISATNEAIVAGTAAASPKVPSPGESRDIPLAIVVVRAGATKIYDEDIIDVRA